MHLPERDGIYADLLLLDLFLRERARGVWPVSRILERFHELAGPSFYRRMSTGEIMSRVTNDLTQVRLLLGFGVLNVINTVFALARVKKNDLVPGAHRNLISV